jgi:hypothetical protein
MRIRNGLLLLLCALAFALLTSCASTSLAERIPDTLEGVCDVYQPIKAHYAEIQSLAIAAHDAGRLPPKVWEAFVWVHEHRGDLDRWLSLVCEPDSSANAHVIAAEKTKVDWNTVGANVLQVAAFALRSGVL